MTALLEAAELSAAALLVLLVVTVLAAVIRGYAGFGFSAIIVASSSLFLPTREAVPLVLILEVLASVAMARQIWRDINWRLVGCILIGVAFFSPLGQYALSRADIDLMRLVTALLLLLAIALVAAGRFFAMRNAPPTWVLTGVVSGFMNGMLAMGGMWTMVFLINSGVKVAVLRASLIALFFITDCYAIGAGAAYGLVDEKLFVRVACLLPFMLVGVKIGAGKFNPDQQETYKKMVLMLLALLAMLLLLRALV